MTSSRVFKPIRYFGSKGTFYNKLLEYFPPKDSYNMYVEPFGGSYTMGLSADLPDKVCEIYNDKEHNVYSLYKVLSDKTFFERFEELCSLAIYDEYTRQKYKEELKRSDIDIVSRAYYFFYVNHTSHNGIGGFSINPIIRRGMAKSVSDMLSCIDRLSELHQRLSRVIVTNKDGIDLVKKYNTENTFLYLDPPYVQSTRTSARYIEDMDDETHNRLIDACIGSKAKILISGYDNPLYDRLTDNGFTKYQFDVNTIGADKKPKVKVETIWKNY